MGAWSGVQSRQKVWNMPISKKLNICSITFIAQLPTYIKFQIAKLLTASDFIPTFSAPKMSNYIDDGSIDP